MKNIKMTVLPLLMALCGLACDGSSDRLTAGAMAYLEGDYKTSLRMWRPLGEQGNAGAQLKLGQLYRQGQGVPQDYKEAMDWYYRAAEQGNGIAQNNLGYMYGTGSGVPPDNVQAHMWFIIAVTSGGEHAIHNRDVIVKEMTPAEIAESQTLAREWMERHQ
jgi:TPR repeat protein